MALGKVQLQQLTLCRTRNLFTVWAIDLSGMCWDSQLLLVSKVGNSPSTTTHPATHILHLYQNPGKKMLNSSKACKLSLGTPETFWMGNWLCLREMIAPFSYSYSVALIRVWKCALYLHAPAQTHTHTLHTTHT